MTTQTKVPDNNVAYYHTYEYKALQELKRHGKMHGARRVIMFCLLTAVLPTILLVIPLYLRHSVYADVVYEVAESDVLEIDDGISSVFCQAHSLRMNSSFHAFQMKGTPKLSPNRKHIRLKKSMILPDDTLEYWGFYLLKGSTVFLSMCSRFEGSRVMVVKGERNLRSCSLLEHKKEGPTKSQMVPGQMRVTFETSAQEIKPPLIKILEPSTTPEPTDEQFEGENLSSENLDFNNFTILEQFAEDYVKKHMKTNLTVQNDTSSLITNSGLGIQNVRRLRHAKSRFDDFETYVLGFKRDQNGKKQQSKKRKKNLKRRYRKNDSVANDMNVNNPSNASDMEIKNNGLDKAHIRSKRSRTHFLDGPVEHGGNANNVTAGENGAESSFSSFENNLRTCYQGQILMNEESPPSHTCTDVRALEIHGTMQAVHEVNEDGYYYYIFYSDNDHVQNDIHAIFNIHKSTYQYAEHTRSCVNDTECTFPITFWSDEIVIAEIPTRDGLERDGIEHEKDDITQLISSCHPRMSVYIIFPIAVLFLILGCAFM